MVNENEKKHKEKPNQRKVAFRNEAIDALVNLEDESLVTPLKAMEVAKLDCKQCKLHETSHNPKHQNCRDNPFCINRLGLEKFEKLISLEIERKEEARKDQKRRDLNDQPAGLVNGGNFCYVNSFLQVWFNVPEFRQIVYDFRPAESFIPPPAPRMDVQTTMMALQDIFYTLQTTPFQDTDKTSNLVKLLRLNSEQQDSQEFGLKFFNALERCLPDHPNGRESLNRIKELFTGEICTRIVCKCGQRSERDETAISLALNIEGHTTLLDALDAYFGDEHLDDYKCSSCGKKGDVSKQSDYTKLPPVIVIQLNRYKYTSKGRQKLKTPLAYPREIAASAFQRTDFSRRPPADMYDLFAVTIHEGNNAECGHYYDLIKSPFNQKWYRYNDETVESIPKPPGTEKPTSSRTEKTRRKEKEKTPSDQKGCYGLLYRRRDPVLPLAHPRLPPDEFVVESKTQIEELFEGQTKQKIEKSEKRFFDLKRRVDKLKASHKNLETFIDKYKEANEIAFLPTSLLSDILAQEYEVAKGEKKSKKKAVETETKLDEEEEALARAIALSEAEMNQNPSTSSETAVVDVGEEPVDTSEKIDIVAIAMEESELPTVAEPSGEQAEFEPREISPRKRLRPQNGTAKYVFSQTRSPRKNVTSPAVQKQPISTRVAALLSSHEMPICGHGKMSIDPILFGDVKAVSRAPAIDLLREYEYRVKLVYDNGQKVYPMPERDRRVFVFTAEDICMDCVREMRQEGIFNRRLDDDERMVRKILKEEKLRCSVKCATPKPDDYFYVAKYSLANFKKSAQTVRENKLAALHRRKGVMHIDSVTTQKEDTSYPPISMKQFRGRPPRKSNSEIPEKIRKIDDTCPPSSEVRIEMTNEPPIVVVDDEDETTENEEVTTTTTPSVAIERIEFNSELRCSHGGINFNQFRHAVSPDEWRLLKAHFDECFEVRCGDEVCDQCRQIEVDAQNGTDNMRILVREMRKRINETIKKVDARSVEKRTDEEEEEVHEEIKYGICSDFIDKLKKLTTRQSTSPPSICQECLLCQHNLPYRGFANENNQKDAHVIGVTEDEWNTFVTEIRNLEEAGDDQSIFVDPRAIHISNGRIVDTCEQCFEKHVKFTEEQKYKFENENIFVKLFNPADEDDVAKANGKASRRVRAKNVYAIKISSSAKLMDLKIQLFDKTHQIPSDQLLYRTVGGEHFDKSNNEKTLFDLRLTPNNNDNPLILMAQQLSSPAAQTDESGDRAPERGFVDTALAH